MDLCRAIAITLFGDASKAKILSISALQRFTALQSGEVDVLTRNTTRSLTRDTTLGLIGVGVNYYDSQGIMVNKSLNVKSAKELDGATVCVQPGTTTELNLPTGSARKASRSNPSWSSAWTRSSARSPWAAATPSPATNPSWPPRAARWPIPIST